MKKLRESAAVKFAAVLLMLAAFFAAGLGACGVLPTLPYVFEDDWRDLGRTYNALEARADSVADLYALLLEREKLWAMMEAGESVDYRLTRLERQIQTAQEALDRERTWFRYRVFDIYGGIYAPTAEDLEDWYALEDEVYALREAVFTPGHHYVEHDGGAWMTEESTWDATGADEGEEAGLEQAAGELSGLQGPLVIEYGVARDMDDSVSDEFTQIAGEYAWANQAFPGRVKTAGAFLAAGLLCLLYLLWASGHRAGAEGAVPSWQEEHIFFDLYFLAAGAALVGLAAAGLWLGDEYLGNLYGWFGPSDAAGFPFRLAEYGLAALFTLAAGICALVLRTVVVRLKTGTFVKTTLLCRAVGWMVKAIQKLLRGLGWLLANIPLVWKTALVCGAYMLSTFVFFLWRWFYFFPLLCLWCLFSLTLVLLVCWWAVGFQQLRKGSRAIAAGELDYRIDTKRLLPDLRACAEDLNNISAGLNSAVEEKTKSERFKAELITNVSHDLKTPLTSIINYVDLLKGTEQTDPKAAEYIEVLDRKSQRLKKLTEDLVEASKASTGVLRVDREKIGMAQLIDQALGEWTEKLEAKRLSLVVSLPEGETWVYADGRHLWRVIDNLLSNCAKYALEGTRVYVDLIRGKGQVLLSVKNISREPLNIPPDQLMERFVRGEESRTTEGSGLGLSIARSLTELQGGTFDLAVDGDLFKAILTLPQAG